MKSVRFCLILASLASLSACSSLPPIYFTHSQKGRVRAAQAEAQASAETSVPAPVAEVPPPAPAPAEVVAPIMVPAPVAPVVPAPAPVVAVASPAVTVPAVVATPGIRATRSGEAVKVEWTLPVNEGGYRSIEIMRNNTSAPQGRTRVRAVRASVTQIEDTVVAGSAERYWYWIKTTAQDGTVSNMGPAEATTAP